MHCDHPFAVATNLVVRLLLPRLYVAAHIAGSQLVTVGFPTTFTSQTLRACAQIMLRRSGLQVARSLCALQHAGTGQAVRCVQTAVQHTEESALTRVLREQLESIRIAGTNKTEFNITTPQSTTIREYSLCLVRLLPATAALYATEPLTGWSGLLQALRVWTAKCSTFVSCWGCTASNSFSTAVQGVLPGNTPDSGAFLPSQR